MVGGSSRILRLRQLVQEALQGKKPLCNAINPDEAVALGAALLGAREVKLVEEKLTLRTTIKCGAQAYGWNANQSLPTTMPILRLSGRNVEVIRFNMPTLGSSHTV